MVQTNLATEQKRSVRIGWVRPQDVHASSSDRDGGAVQLATNADLVPIVEVALKYEQWSVIPQDISAQLYEDHKAGNDTRYDHYTIDFFNMVQTNIKTGGKRSVRILWVRPQDVQARFTGKTRREHHLDILGGMRAEHP